MSKKLIVVAMIMVVVSLCEVGFAQTPDSDHWVDYASGEYDIFPNIVYSTRNNTELKLDVYFPKDQKEPRPALLLFHGGGWVAGQKERNVMQLLPYLSMTWIVINVEYRQAPNSLAPAAVEDARCALRWVAYNAKRFNIDTTKIVLTGGSAGGHLALMTGMLPHGSPFDRACPTDNSTKWVDATEPTVRVAAIVCWYGIADVADLLEGPNARHYAIEWFGNMSNRMELAKQISPVNYVRPGVPPIISIHGDEDNVAPYSQIKKLHAELDKAGVPNRLVTIKGAKHAGYSRQAFIDSFKSIRDFLRQNRIISESTSR